MLNEKIENALNEQVNKEFWSAYLYLAMSMNFENTALKGLANWFMVQYREELAHAEIFINYINQRGGTVRLQPIAEVPQKWESPLEAFQSTLAHEETITASINKIYALTEQLHDYATRDRLGWFIAEQVEEEDNVRHLVEQAELVGLDGAGLYEFDKTLATRTYVEPAPLQTK